jgi:hypothetical protein
MKLSRGREKKRANPPDVSLHCLFIGHQGNPSTIPIIFINVGAFNYIMGLLGVKILYVVSEVIKS